MATILLWRENGVDMGSFQRRKRYDAVFSRPLHQPHHLWRNIWRSCILLIPVCMSASTNASPLTHYYSLWRHMASDILVNIGSGSLLSVRRQAIASTNFCLLSTRFYGTYFNKIQFDSEKFSFKKMHLIILSAKHSTSRVCFSSLCRRDDGPMGNYYCVLVFRMLKSKHNVREYWHCTDII